MPIINDITIKEYDQERQQRIRLIQENTAYVKGKNPTITNANPQKKPDNRIPIPLGKIAVESLSGYASKMNLYWENISTDESEVNNEKDDEYIDLQRKIAEHNKETLETSELYEKGLTQGVSYELMWISDELDLQGVMTPEYVMIPNSEVVLLWSRDLKPKLEGALRFQQFRDNHTVDVYYPLYSERWEKPKGADEWTRNQEGDTVYPMTDVPLYEFPINYDQDSLFEAEKNLIDANDKILNNTVNEVDRYNALIAMFPGLVTKDFKDKLVDVGVIDDLEQYEKWPSYLQKNLSGVNELYSDIAKRVEKLYFQSVSVPNFADDDFLNAESGIALQFKLLGLEFLASKIETYFFKGLHQRNKLINDIIGERFKTEDYKMVIEPVRNLPVDFKNKAEVAQILNGIVSKETLLRMLPMIDDVEKELERLEGEVVEVDLDNIPDPVIED